MSIRNKPNYGIYTLSLATANAAFDMPILGTRVHFVRAVDATGAIAPNALVNLQVGKALGDAIPMGVNARVNVDDLFEFIRLSWAAQAGITATFLICDDRNGAGVEIDAPVASLQVSGAITDNVTQFAGQPVNIGPGAAGTGTPRVAVASDSSINLASDYNAHKFGASNAQNMTVGAVVIQLLAPASNVNGCVLRSLALGAGGATTTVHSDTAAPSAYNDATKRVIAVVPSTGSQLSWVDKLIPAGHGIWVSASAGTSYCGITFDLL